MSQNVESESLSIRSLESAIEKLVAVLPPLVIASRLRRARLSQGISVRDLAEAAGLSKNSLTRVEQGKEVRAMTILKVCSALGLHVEMLADPENQESAAVHRAEDDRWYDMTGFGSGALGGHERPLTAQERASFASEGVAVPLLRLKSRLAQGKVLPSVLEVHAPSEPRSHPGEEFVYVLSGKAIVRVGDTDYTLNAGESIDFWAEELHCYSPVGNEPALLLSVRVNP